VVALPCGRGSVTASMPAEQVLQPLPIVLGPTGSGKSELAIQIALALGGEIVNCDSLQIYRGFDVGTAKVPEAARRGVPHHLIDLLDPGQVFTAGDYAREARAVLRDIAARRRVPIVVGGTGFYLRALLDGLSHGPSRNPALRQRLQHREQKRPLSLHRILSRLDPTAASRIHGNDTKKIIRALEVRLLEGRPMSEFFAQGRDPLTGFHAIKLGLNPPRALLNQRLDARTVGMFEAGLIEEVRMLLSSGVPRDAKPFESLGYKQALEVLEGRLTLQQAIQSTQLETRRYAKRQVTWFRKEPDVNWLNGFGDDPDVQAQALTKVEESAS
jgi:tRNA dimethylallyltransferase